MNRPRRPFGSTRPGQLLGTRIKVLAAELSDPDRLRRGRTYATDGSVVDITVAEGVATGTVLGSRRDPYLVEVTVDEGDGPPTRSEVSASCNCPDDDLQSHSWCKHAIATLLTLADEVALDPDVLARWRGAATSPVDDTTTSPSAPPPDNVRPLHGTSRRRRPPPTDPLAGTLAVPDGATIPIIPEIETTVRVRVPDEALEDLITTAIATLVIEADTTD